MKKNSLYILSIVILTLLAWHKVYYQSFMGEGYFYFNHTLSFNNSGAMLNSLFRYDTLARLLFDILPKFFGDNLQLYMLWMLAIVCLVNILYYLLVYTLTEKKIIALIASMLFAVNYVTSYEMLGIGNYQFFAQRIPIFIFVFLSFFLLVRFFKKKSGKFSYLGSIALYLLSVLFTTFGVFFLPMFVFYAFAFWIEKTKDWKSFLLKFCLVVPFVVGTFVFLWLDRLYGDSLIVDKSFFDYIFRNPELIANIAYQLPWLTLPQPILKSLVEPHFREPVIVLSIPITLFYLIAVSYLRQRQCSLRPLIYSLVLFIPSALFLNVYVRSTQVYRIYEGSRYFYVPSMAFSIFLAIFLYSLFFNKKLVGKLVLIALLSWWVFFNLGLIWTDIDEGQEKHIASKRTLRYVKEKSLQYPKDSFIVLPKIIGYHGADFCKKFYGRGSMRFVPIFAEWEKRLEKDFDLGKLIVLDYDYDKKLVVDRSKEFQELLRAERN